MIIMKSRIEPTLKSRSPCESEGCCPGQGDELRVCDNLLEIGNLEVNVSGAADAESAKNKAASTEPRTGSEKSKDVSSESGESSVHESEKIELGRLSEELGNKSMDDTREVTSEKVDSDSAGLETLSGLLNVENTVRLRRSCSAGSSFRRLSTESGFSSRPGVRGWSLAQEKKRRRWSLDRANQFNNNLPQVSLTVYISMMTLYLIYTCVLYNAHQYILSEMPHLLIILSTLYLM